MRKLLVLFTGLVLTLTGCISKVMAPNGKIEYAHSLLNIDETNMEVYVGTVDYIFIGTVNSIKNDEIDYDSEYSTYSITVDENLKGNLVSSIECKKFGGYLKDGTLLLYEGEKLKDSGLPQEDNQYIFMAYGQPDGTLHLSEFHGNVPYTGEGMKEEYLNYIDNEVQDSRQRFISKYDINYTE